MAGIKLFPVSETLTRHNLVVHEVQSDTNAQYPSSYFSATVKKPILEFLDFSVLRGYRELSDMVNGATWSDLTVSGYMVAYLEANPENYQIKLPAPWTVDGGVQVGRKLKEGGYHINPLDLVTLKPKLAGDDPPILENVDQALLDGRFYALLMLYRKIITKSNLNRWVNTAIRLNDFFKANGLAITMEEHSNWSGMISDDTLTPNYRKIIAVIDMYFFRHKEELMSKLRIATLPSRYRGCVAITALGQIANHLGKSPGDLLQYVITVPVAKDVARIGKDGEGAWKIDGYFPYQSDLGLVQRTQYSLSLNPTLCFWLHTIGCITGLTRSRDAKMPPANDVVGTFEMGALVALTLTNPATEESKPSVLDDDEATPLTTLDLSVKEIIEQYNFNKGLSEDQYDKIRQRVIKYRTCKIDTVGGWIYQHCTRYQQ